MTTASPPSGFAATGSVFLDFSLLFYVIGFASPDWLKKTSFPTAHTGLWQSCVTVEVDNNTYSKECISTKQFVNDAWNSTWVPGLQTIMSLGLVCLIMATVAANVYVCARQVWNNPGAAFISLCTTFSATFLALIGIIILGVRRYDAVFTDYTFSASFALSCTSLCFTFLACSLFFMEVARLNSEAVERKFGVPCSSLYRRPVRRIEPDDAVNAETRSDASSTRS